MSGNLEWVLGMQDERDELRDRAAAAVAEIEAALEALTDRPDVQTRIRAALSSLQPTRERDDGRPG